MTKVSSSTRDQIEAARIALDMSYRQLAIAAGLHDETVRLYLRGEIDTGSEKADALVRTTKLLLAEQNA